MRSHNHHHPSKSETASADPPDGTQSIQRAVAVLRLLATASEAGLGLTEISIQSAIPHPSVHRILSVLIAEGIVEQRSGTRRYVIGEQIPLLALSRRSQDPLLDIVGPHLRDLVRSIGDTGFLTRRAGQDSVCVARQLGTYPIQVLAWNVGERRPLGVTNAGIAILSGMQTDSARRILASNRLRLSQYGLSSKEILQEVATARSRGFAMRAKALVPGTSAISVLVRSFSSAGHAALSINQVSRRLTPRRTDDVVEQLRVHAEAIERELRNAAASRSPRT
jgi:DNA-binding IclR family transcriptional regulator